MQTSRKHYPYYSFAGNFPHAYGNYSLFKSLKETVPIIDAAISKLVRLMGEFTIKTGNNKADKELAEFLEYIEVGANRQGIDAFLTTFMSQLLTFGTAVGEIVLDDRNEIVNLFNSNLRDVALTIGENPLELIVSSRGEMGEFKPVSNPGLILCTVHDPEPGKAYGTSVLEGLPFVADILMKIFAATGSNWERMGNVRYCVTYKPQTEGADKAFAQSRAKLIADEWSKTINADGTVKDFVAVGDVEIKAIGADNQILDSEVPVRQLLEQIVAKLGIPPFLLGLSWSSTERMSSQQADILTSEIEAYRRELNPVIRKICRLWLLLNGYDADISIEWNDITLQDITELAESEYIKAQTAEILQNLNKEGAAT